jgi:ammonia channel protein AmtB
MVAVPLLLQRSEEILLRTNPIGFGYLLSSTLLVFTVILGIDLLTAGTMQMLAGLIDIRQFIGFVASFAILTFFAIGFTLALFRNVSERTSSQDAHLLDVV